MTGRTPIRVTSACESPATGIDRPRGCEERQSGLERGVVQHLLHVQGQEEEVREHDRAEEDAAHVRSGHGAHAEDAERHDRRTVAQLDHDERREEHRRADQLLDRVRGAPADLRRLRDRVDEEREARGDRDRAARVEAAQACDPALAHDRTREREHERADGHVDEEDPLPAGVLREDAAERARPQRRRCRPSLPRRRAPCCARSPLRRSW